MFLTLEDPRAKIQGSRDPLGLQPIWSRFGRKLVCNLTTVSRAVRGFSVLLVGRYFAEELIREGKANEEDAIQLFLKFEQIAAYSRYVAMGDEGGDIVLGITRVKKRHGEGKGSVRISERQTDQILSDQQSYGLWGLYSVPARVSGLLEPGPVGITEIASEFVEQEYASRLHSQRRALTKLIRNGGKFRAKANIQPCKSLSSILGSGLTPNERDFYGSHLRDAVLIDTGQTEAAKRQSALAQLLLKLFEPDEGLTRTGIERLHQSASKNDTENLADWLSKILRLEATIAPAEIVFNFVIANDRQSVKSVAREIHDCWGSNIPHVRESIEFLRGEIKSTINSEQESQLIRTNNALADGNFEEVVAAVVDWNKAVMETRGSAAWVTIKNGKLDVKSRGRDRQLPTGDQLLDLWANSYFISSLKALSFQLEN